MADILPDLDRIQEREEALHRPDVRRSRAALEELLADGFVEFGASGSVYQRADIIDLLLQEEASQPGDLQADNYKLTPIQDGAALLTYETRRRRQDGSERHVLRSSIWIRDGGEWRMLFHQGTIVGF